MARIIQAVQGGRLRALFATLEVNLKKRIVNQMYFAADQIDETLPTSVPIIMSSGQVQTSTIDGAINTINTAKDQFPFSCFRDVLATVVRVNLQDDTAEFAQMIFLQMVEENPSSNFIFSPASMYAAMTTVLAGTTRWSSAFQNLLEYNVLRTSSTHWIKCNYDTIINLFESQKSLKHGNKLWVQNEVDIKPSFRKTILSSEVSNLDFHDPENSVNQINEWVASVTEEKILKIVEEVSEDTSIFLSNVVDFEENWLLYFDDFNGEVEDLEGLEVKLLKGAFDTPQGVKQVRMIQQVNSNATYGEIKIFGNRPCPRGKYCRPDVQVVSLPYRNKRFELQIIIPKNLAWLELKMNSSDKRDLSRRSEGFFNLFMESKNETYANKRQELPKNIHIRLPKFQVRSDLDMVESMKKLGVTNIFESGAEFGELGDGPLHMSRMSHTAQMVMSKCGPNWPVPCCEENTRCVDPDQPFVPFDTSSSQRLSIDVDRPFIFVVWDKKEGIPVLVGRIMDPTI